MWSTETGRIKQRINYTWRYGTETVTRFLGIVVRRVIVWDLVDKS